MIQITLPDGAVRELAKGSTAMDVAKSISEGFARNVFSAKVNGETVEGARFVVTLPLVKAPTKT